MFIVASDEFPSTGNLNIDFVESDDFNDVILFNAR